MKRYSVEMVRDASTKYFYIRDNETMGIVELPSRYLKHKTMSKRSPNTVRRSAFSILYYLEYLETKEMGITDVYRLPYDRQTEHFTRFLEWIKSGCHTEGKTNKLPDNRTCNAYLKDVFRFYLFIEESSDDYGELKVLYYNQFVEVNSVGVKRVLRNHSFKGYLKEERRRGKPAKQNEIVTILQSCTNCRDQLLLLLLAETGFRIGEILGVNYVKDIDYRNHLVGVYFREDNENDSRAKNAEYRKAKISDSTFEFLLYYIAEYRELLQHQTFLFINIMGDGIGKPLKVDSVYKMLERMEKKTQIKITPHMLRRYFANMRREAGWRLEMISQALGHKHLETTIQYLNMVDDNLIEASNEFYERHSAIYGIQELLKESEC